MIEVYTCVCGNQHWIISDEEFECVKCKAVYGVDYIGDRMEAPKTFNERIQEEDNG